MKFGDGKQDGLKFSYALSLAMQLGFLIVSSIAGFLLLGWWLDEKFATEPWLLLCGVIIGVSSATYGTYRLLKPLL